MRRKPGRAATASEPDRTQRLFAEDRPAPRPRAVAPAELTVFTSGEDLVRWSRRRIADVLVREARIDGELAVQISGDIESTLKRAGLSTVSTALLRDLVGAELVSRGLTAEWMRHARLGVSPFDVGALLRATATEAGPRARLSPEATTLALGGRIKRDYALSAVFSEPVAEAHRKGSIHIHDLEAVDRPAVLTVTRAALAACAAGGEGIGAGAAADAETYVARVASLVATLGQHLAMRPRLDGLNVVLAPFLATRSDAELARAARTVLGLLGEGSSTSGAPLRATLHWDLPSELAAAEAIGPRGKTAGRYRDHEAGARRVAGALLAAAASDPAPLLDLVVVLGQGFFRTPGHLGLLEQAAAAARTGGVPRFRFRRPREKSPSPAAGGGPRAVPSGARDAVLSLVSLSLPRLAYLAGGDEEAIETRLYSALELAARAHMEKRVFLEDILARGASGSLGVLIDRARGGPFLDVEEAVHPILLSGLNELVELVTGRPLHSGTESFELAQRVLSRVTRHVDRLSRRYKLRFVVGGEPHHEPAARFARLDLRHHSQKAGHHLKGELRRGQVRYTPGVALDLGAAVPARHRIELEGRLHAHAPWNAFSTVRAGDLKGGAALVMEAYTRTLCRELQVTPDEP